MKEFELNNIVFARCLLILIFLISIFMNVSLWVSDFSFPLIPISKIIIIPAYFYSQIILILFIFLLVFMIFKPTKLVGFLILAVLLHLFATDINRLQPSFYIFSILVLLFLFSGNDKQLSTCIIILFAAIYFWSGLHKYNSKFLEIWMGGLSRRIGFVPEILRSLFTYSVPFLEASFGLLLLFKQSRKIGAICLILMHIIIITFLLISNIGLNVLPLNFLMIFILYLIIYKSDYNLFFKFDLSIVKIILIAFVWLLPILNFYGYWDHFLSFSILSGKPKYAFLIIENEKIETSISADAREYITVFNKNKILSLNTWAHAKKGIMIYPQTRVYVEVKNYLNKDLANKKSLKLIEY